MSCFVSVYFKFTNIIIIVFVLLNNTIFIYLSIYLSEKSIKFLSSDMSKHLCISFIYNIHNIGPKIYPCGTPIFNFKELF